MYETYFGLIERPFSIAPDPQYLYMSTRHKEAMAHLSYGLSQGGCFIVLTGEVGTGKTTLCRNLLNDLPDNVDIALILNANINEQELLQTVCDELGIKHQQSDTQKQLLGLINQHLLTTFADNRRTVLIIDEAQLLSRDVLEKIRLLTNLETTKSKLLQIILIGQPELNQLLARNDLRQLTQRITARYHLGELARNEMEDYVNYRLAVAGCKRPIFTKQALNKIYILTEGIPRKINVLADHALLSAYSENQNTVDAKMVKQSAKDVFIDEGGKPLPKKVGITWLLSIATLLLFANLFVWWFLSERYQFSFVGSLADLPTMVERNIGNGVANKTIPSDSGSEPALETSLSTMTADVEALDSDDQAPIVTDQVESLDAETQAMEQTVELDQHVLDEQLVSQQPLLASQTSALQTAVLEQSALISAQPETSSLPLILEAAADQTGRFQSFRRLASSWQQELPEKIIQPVCQAVEEAGLACLPIYDWRQVEHYNRPTILVLEHAGTLHRVVLTKLFDDRATIYVGSRAHTVTVEQLRSLWNKKGMAFWRPSEIGNPFYQQGDQSSDIVWLRWYLGQALSTVSLPALQNTTSPVFDLDMSQKVFTLQNGFKITADSKIGDETYLLINELINPTNTPMLVKREL